MSVVLEIDVAADDFLLGEILRLEADVDFTLETEVPLGGTAVPFVRVHDGSVEGVASAIEAHPAVDHVERVMEFDGDSLFGLEWDASQCRFFSAIRDLGGHLVDAHSHGSRWDFRLVFPDHASVSAFNDRLREADVHVEVRSVSNPWSPEPESGDALTTPQREALRRAVEEGYYDIPRRVSTSQLADEFDISDQAMTERLRRAISTMAESALEESRRS